MTILDKILVRTRDTVAADRSRRSASELEAAIADLPPCRDFHAALDAEERVQLIAEIKRASPSAGVIRQDFDPPEIATAYRDGGAACISVLTDQPFFQGSLEFLRAVRAAVDEALAAKEAGEERVILFNLSGHGYFDMGAYDAFFAGQLEDYEHPQERIDEALKHLPEIG